MAYSNNGTVTSGGTAQDILADGHAVFAVIIENESDTDFRARVGATATTSAGDLVKAGTSQEFRNLLGRRISIFGATTGKAWSFRETI